MVDMSTSLAALIGSRICHDLISPIGAINNGLELMGILGDPSGPEMGLIGESVDNASARIRFFRIAFGAASDQMVGPTEVRSILRDLYDGSRLVLEWDVIDPASRVAVRLAFLGVLCMETAMPYGGKIHITAQNGRWRLQGFADRINVDADLWALLSGPVPKPDLLPSHVQFALVPLIAHDAGLQVTCATDTSSIMVEF